MTKIIKLYLDIGCLYQGDEGIENIYDDIENWNIKDCGIISMIKLEIDIERKTTKELFFRQVLGPMYKKFKCSINDYKKYTSCILKEFKDVDVFVTFNGRDFDIPIIINNLNVSDKNKEYHLRYFAEKDRDLLDLCLLKNMPVKGGLRTIAKKLDIHNNLIDLEMQNDEKKICILSSDECINRYNRSLLRKKKRNEYDIKVLPLLEEKLGFLYEPRLPIDRYHKRWI